LVKALEYSRWVFVALFRRLFISGDDVTRKASG
jgi:hypothetical protein